MPPPYGGGGIINTQDSVATDLRRGGTINSTCTLTSKFSSEKLIKPAYTCHVLWRLFEPMYINYNVYHTLTFVQGKYDNNCNSEIYNLYSKYLAIQITNNGANI